MKFRIHTIYKTKANHTTRIQSDWIEDHHILVFLDDFENTGKFQSIEIEDDTGSTWTKKEVKRLLTKIEQEPEDIELYFDGSYQRETNQAGIGVVLYYRVGEGKFRERYNEKIEQMASNNEVEYAALYYGLNRIEDLQIKGKRVVINGDSQGLLMQLKGEWPCYEENLNRWLDRIEEKIKKLKLHAEYKILPRNENKEADKLASQAIQEIAITSKQKLDN